MNAWANYWSQGHSTTFGEYYREGYTKGFVADWIKDVSSRMSDGQRILEVGCGTGSLIPGLAASKLGLQYIGVDAAQTHNAQVLPDNAGLSVQIIGEQPIESFEADEPFDFLLSVYGYEYAGKGAAESVARLCKHGGQLNMLVHHSSSVITEMSEKAVSEFDFDLVAKLSALLADIDSELNRLGAVEELPKSTIACEAREAINTEVSNIMNRPADQRNAISVDLAMNVLGYFKIIRQDAKSRAELIGGLMPSFRASQERFKQMLAVAKGQAGIEELAQELKEAGFGKVDYSVVEENNREVAWSVSASLS